MYGILRDFYTLQHSTTATSELIASRSLHNFPTCRSESEPAAAPPRPGQSWSAEAAALAQLFPAKIKIQSSSGRLTVLSQGTCLYSSILRHLHTATFHHSHFLLNCLQIPTILFPGWLRGDQGGMGGPKFVITKTCAFCTNALSRFMSIALGDVLGPPRPAFHT